MKNEITINTSKIKNIEINNNFYKNYKIYKIKINNDDYKNTSMLISKIRKNIEVLSYFKSDNFIYILSNKKIKVEDFNFTELYKFSENEKYIFLNLIIKTLHKIENEYNMLEGLSYYFNKVLNYKNIEEFVFYEIEVSKSMEVLINVATYSRKDQLLAETYNSKEKQRIENKTTYLFQGETEIVKIKHKLSKKNYGIANTLTTNEFYKSKINFLIGIKNLLNSMTTIFTFELEEITGQFLLRNEDTDMISRLSSDLTYDDEMIDFYKNKSIGIINLIEENVKGDIVGKIKTFINVLLYGANCKIKVVKNKKGKSDVFIIITHNKSFYMDKNKEDPINKMRGLNSHILNFDHKNTFNKSINKPIVETILKELILKNNIKEMEIKNFKTEMDSVFFDIDVRTGFEHYIDGLKIKNNKMFFINNESNEFKDVIKLLEEKEVVNILDENNACFLSYGNSNENLYDNKFLIYKHKKVPLPLLSNLEDHFLKKNNDSSTFMTRSNKNYGKDSGLHGFYGIFYKEKSGNIVFYIGTIVESPQSKMTSFTGLYEAKLIDGTFNPIDFFSFFEKSYITYKDSTKKPYLLKYIRLKNEYKDSGEI